MGRKRFRKSRKRRGRKRRRVTASRNMGPLSVKLKTNMIYHEQFTLDPGASGITGFVFSANGCFDPSITTAGAQPRGFDQLVGTLYDHYTVIGSKITIIAANADEGNGVMLAMLVRDTATQFTTVVDVMENRFVKFTPLAVEGGGPNTKTMTLKVNPNRFLGRSHPLSDPQLKGSASANPVEQCYFHIYVFSLPAGVNTAATYCQARIQYNAILTEPKQPGQS